MRCVELVMCVTSGAGYVAGEIYPIVGSNNGIHICRENEEGDCEDNIFQTGGIGKGIFNSLDDTGAPSFDPYIEVNVPDFC